MRVKIEIEQAPPEVNAALAVGREQDFLYGAEHIRELLHVALKVRAESIVGDLSDWAETRVEDLNPIAQEMAVIANYERELWRLDPIKQDLEAVAA